MDANQQSHRYLRPPPPPPPPPPPGPPQQPSSMADHYPHHNPYIHHQQQQQQPGPPPPQTLPGASVPTQGHQWYPNQFQFQPHPSYHSLSSAPPSQWARPPPSSSFPPPPPQSYPAHHYPPPPPPQVSQSYPQPNQDWSNPNWNHHQQGWDYTSQNNTQDWAARAKEWATARVTMDNQHLQSQYPQSADYHYADTEHQSIPASSHQQYHVPPAQLQQPPVAYQQENTAISFGLSGSDRTPAEEANVGFPHQEISRPSPSVHQQEVPSSYSSVPGIDETANQKGDIYRSLPMPISSAEGGQLFAYGNQAADPPTDLRDQPLDFAPRCNHDQDLHMQSTYTAHHESAGIVRGVDPAVAAPSVNSWTPPVAPGVAYRPTAPVLPAGPQHDPSVTMASVPGPAAPQFGRFPVSGFQSTIPSASSFGIGAGATLHPTTVFPGDVYGVSGISGISERPKKTPVPNWLKEEIIKNKAAVTKSSIENAKGDPVSIEDEFVLKSSRKDDQAERKSIDSSRSTEEEEDDDEDYVEAARTAAVNQEIKRILTEVLSKVTDELFDEIATKVISEDDLAIEVNGKSIAPKRKLSPPPAAVPTPKASAKVLVPVNVKESEAGVSEKTSLSSRGDVLGLANYASDDDDDDDGDDEIQCSSRSNSRINVVTKSSLIKYSEHLHDATENGLHVKPEKEDKDQTHSGRVLSKPNGISAIGMLDEKRDDAQAYFPSAVPRYGDNDTGVDVSGLNETLGENTGMKLKNDLPGTIARVKTSTNDYLLSTETRMKSAKNDRRESKMSSSEKDNGKEAEISSGVDDKGDKNHRRKDERHSRKEKTDDWNGSRDEGAKSEVKTKESRSRKRSTDDVKEDRKDVERCQKDSTKEGTDKKRGRSKEEDVTRHKHTSNRGRHKKRRSSSISSRDRDSNDSSDQSSDDSKRKRHSRKRHFSPSPVRSSRRQVTRSPHSKHSQRRHSPYSSLETNRGRRSRSRSPVRKQR